MLDNLICKVRHIDPGVAFARQVQAVFLHVGKLHVEIEHGFEVVSGDRPIVKGRESAVDSLAETDLNQSGGTP